MRWNRERGPLAALLLLAATSAPAQEPSFQTYVAPSGLGELAGEPTVGWNPHTRRALYAATVETLRITFPEDQTPPRAESCDAQWEDASYALTGLSGADPIVVTDGVTGRSFVATLTFTSLPPSNIVSVFFAFSDDDGATWTPGHINPPAGGNDHEAIATGPYPAGSTPPSGDRPTAVYYCSHLISNLALCRRSDDGGLTFGAPTIANNAVETSCSAFHGHPKVAPDGSVYLPFSGCFESDGGAHPGEAVSTDAGATWEFRHLPFDGVAGVVAADPSIGVAADGAQYFCYLGADSHPRVAVSRDRGLSWTDDTDLAAATAIAAAVFPSAAAGDPDRAACAFLATTTPGNYQALDFPGTWHAYVAATYDGGRSWSLHDTTPHDPVQGPGGICLGGGNCAGENRNLLDFADLEIDDRGRLLFAYADGCVDGCATGGANTFAAKATLARQSGGRRMLAAFDDEAAPAVAATGCAEAGAKPGLAAVDGPAAGGARFGGGAGSLGLTLLLLTAAGISARKRALAG